MLRSHNGYSFSDRRKSYIKYTSGGSLELIVNPEPLRNTIYLMSCGGFSDKKTELIFLDNNIEFMSFSVNGSFIFDFNASWYTNFDSTLKIRLNSLTNSGSIALSYLVM